MQKGIIVDDASIMRIRLRKILEKEFAIIEEASNYEEALKMYSEQAPDFLALDITMPQMNGTEALKSILAQHPEARIVNCQRRRAKRDCLRSLGARRKGFYCQTI